MAKQSDTTKPEVVDSTNVNREAVKVAFDLYDSKAAEVKQAEAVLAAKIQERSAACQAILTASGGYKGPFVRQGATVKIVVRDGLAFLRGRSESAFEV